MTRLDETMVGNDRHPYSSLYQVETCVRVTPRSWSGNVGQVILRSTSDAVIVAVENQLMLFSAIDRQLVSTLNFQSPIDCVAFNDDGSLLVVGERTGDIHAISGKTGEQVASQQLAVARADDGTPLFKVVEFGGGVLCRLAVLTSRGQLHVIDGLQMRQLKHSVIDVTDATSCLTVLPNGDIITADDSLNLWSNDDGEFGVAFSCPTLFGSAVRCAALPCGGKLIVLDSDGHLVLWNTTLFVAISMLDCADVVDFVLVDRPGDSRKCFGTIATLQKSEISRSVNIYSLPSTELVYSIDVHHGALLFPSSVLNDCVYFLEMWSANAANRLTDTVSGLQVRRLAETDPQTRVRRLLAKQHFLEAESFAEKFSLDVQCVFHEYLSYLVTKLSAPVDNDDNVDDLISELMRCLGKLNDVPFVVECCITTALPDLAATNQLLSLAHDRLDKSRCLSSELHSSLVLQLCETSRRLAAFQVTRFHFYCQSYCHFCFLCLMHTKVENGDIGMRAAYSFKHPLFSDYVEFCAWLCPHGFSKCFFSVISCPIELIF